MKEPITIRSAALRPKMRGAFAIATLILGCMANGACEREKPRAENALASVTLTQTELAKAFERAGPNVFEAKTADQLLRIKSLRSDTSLTTGDNGLSVKAEGNDPALELPTFVQGQRLILEVVIDSPAETVIQLFYLKRGQSGYTEEASQSFAIKAGQNTVYFGLTEMQIVDPLRLDPGAVPGNYTIRSIVARSLGAQK